jgi:hypothetical protein
MALAWRSAAVRRASQKRRRRGLGVAKWFLAISVGICLIIAVIFTQQERINSALSGKDNSLNGRISYPLRFMFAHADRVVAGYGLTPQADVMQYTVMTYAMKSGNLESLTSSMTATSTSITFLIGVGFGGLALFYLVMFLMQRSTGVWVVSVFVLSNIINSGYNSSTTFVLSALLVSLLVYQLSLAKSTQLQPSRSTVRIASPPDAQVVPV